MGRKRRTLEPALKRETVRSNVFRAVPAEKDAEIEFFRKSHRVLRPPLEIRYAMIDDGGADSMQSEHRSGKKLARL